MPFKRHNPGCPCCDEISSSSSVPSSGSSIELIQFCQEPTPATLHLTVINLPANCGCASGIGSVALPYVDSTIYGNVGPGYQALNVSVGCGSETIDFAIKCEGLADIRLYVKCSSMLGALSRLLFPTPVGDLVATRSPFFVERTFSNFRQCCGLSSGEAFFTFVITE